MVDKVKIKSFVMLLLDVLKKTLVLLKERLLPLLEKTKTLEPNAKKRLFSSIIIFIFSLCIVIFGGVFYILTIFALGCLMVYELIKMLGNLEQKNNRYFVLLRRWGVLYVIACCISLVLVREALLQGLKITIWMFFVVWSVDVFAYIFGKKFGKLKLAPTISPNKTYEGAIFGSACGIFVSIIMYKLFYTAGADSFSLDSFVILSILVVILAQLGDLSESMIKRQCDVKDSGNIIPGHGGVLDRFDSFLIVAPFVYLVLFFNGGVLF